MQCPIKWYHQISDCIGVHPVNSEVYLFEAGDCRHYSFIISQQICSHYHGLHRNARFTFSERLHFCFSIPIHTVRHPEPAGIFFHISAFSFVPLCMKKWGPRKAQAGTYHQIAAYCWVPTVTVPGLSAASVPAFFPRYWGKQEQRPVPGAAQSFCDLF